MFALLLHYHRIRQKRIHDRMKLMRSKINEFEGYMVAINNAFAEVDCLLSLYDTRIKEGKFLLMNAMSEAANWPYIMTKDEEDIISDCSGRYMSCILICAR